MEKKSFGEKIMHIINIVGNAILMNLAFLVACLPVVTIGPAWAGLYSAVRYEVRGDKWFTGFVSGFKTRFLRSMFAGIILSAVCLYFGNNAFAGINALIAGLGGWVSTGVTCVFLLFFMMLYAALIPLNVYFKTDLNTWIEYAWRMMGKAPLQLIGTAVLMWALAFVLIFNMLTAFYLLMVFVGVYFTFAGLVATMLLKNALIDVLNEEKARNPELERD